MIIERAVDRPKNTEAVPLAAATGLIEAIGTAAFVQAALNAAHDQTGADFISLFCLGDRDQPVLMETACRLGQHRADRAASGYEHHVDADQNVELLQGAQGSGDFLTIQQAHQISSFAYRRDCYDLPGISGRMSLVRRAPSYGLSVNVYSSTETGFFPIDMQARVWEMLGLLMAATERHVAFTLKEPVWQGQNVQTRLTLNYPDLTPREREVIAMAIKGRTAEESAEILGLAVTTIITHRKKAYKRMKVESLRQLLAVL
jgi:DNA-binding CsgD family transcriptional regulator